MFRKNIPHIRRLKRDILKEESDKTPPLVTEALLSYKFNLKTFCIVSLFSKISNDIKFIKVCKQPLGLFAFFCIKSRAYKITRDFISEFYLPCLAAMVSCALTLFATLKASAPLYLFIITLQSIWLSAWGACKLIFFLME